MSSPESNYVAHEKYLSPMVHERELAFRESDGHIATEYGNEEEWLRCIQDVFPRFIPFLNQKCGVRFHGRILEIGAGTCWFSAELSKLPEVTEIFATDFSPKLLREIAPRVFATRQANTGKITRMPCDFHKLASDLGSFDAVVCSAVLHHAVDPITVLREARRVLKPNGTFVAIREPVWPLLRFKRWSKIRQKLVDSGVNENVYTLTEYRRFFSKAGLDVRVCPVNLATGAKYLFNALVNGLTHARYAFIATPSDSTTSANR